MIEPVNINNLENLLNKIWNKELKHDQKNFFCGTAACLAGWDFILNSKVPEESINNLRKKGHSSFIHDKDLKDLPFDDVWDWSTSYNNLTNIEADLLFGATATKSSHKAILEAFRRGRRLHEMHGRDVEDLYETIYERLDIKDSKEGFSYYLQGTTIIENTDPDYFYELSYFFKGIENVVINQEEGTISFLAIK
jgi:hypothetical protein